MAQRQIDPSLISTECAAHLMHSSKSSDIYWYLAREDSKISTTTSRPFVRPWVPSRPELLVLNRLSMTFPPKWRCLRKWNRMSSPSLLALPPWKQTLLLPLAVSVQQRSRTLLGPSDGSTANGVGRVRMMTALCLAWAHTCQSMCPGYSSDQLRPGNVRLPKPERKFSLLPTCRVSTGMTDSEFTEWRLFTDGGFENPPFTVGWT